MSDFDPDLNNPYRAPVTADAPPPQNIDGDAAQIRREHLKHEASLKGIGALYILGGIFAVLAGFSSFMSLTAMRNEVQIGGTELTFALVIAAVILGIGVLQFAVGLGMRKVKPWVKIPATIVAAIGLISIPVGTLLGFYVMYLIHSSKGQVVLTESYQQVMAQTPEIKYKTSIIVKVLLVILLVVLALGIGAAVFNA